MENCRLLEQSEHTQLLIKFTIYLIWAQLKALENKYNSNTEDEWSQITIANEKVWNTGKITKMWKIDMKWTKCNTEIWSAHIGKMVSINLVYEVLPQTFNLQKVQYLQSVIKRSEIKWAMPVSRRYQTEYLELKLKCLRWKIY